jgi:hypothetical protein
MANPVSTFTAGLCLMGGNGELVPYDTMSIEAASHADAIQLAREWAQTAALSGDSHLRVLLNGESVASLEPGEF